MAMHTSNNILFWSASIRGGGIQLSYKQQFSTI